MWQFHYLKNPYLTAQTEDFGFIKWIKNMHQENWTSVYLSDIFIYLNLKIKKNYCMLDRE